MTDGKRHPKDFGRYEGYTGSCTATPESATMIALLGKGGWRGPVSFTRSQTKALEKIYWFEETPRESPEELHEKAHAAHEARVPRLEAKLQALKDDPEATRYAVEKVERDLKQAKEAKPPTPMGAEGLRNFLDAGTFRDIYRLAERDGLRLMAFLAPFLEYGEDPVKFIAWALSDAGYDVDASILYVDEEE